MVLTSTDSIPADRVSALADAFIRHPSYPRNWSPRTVEVTEAASRTAPAVHEDPLSPRP